MVGAAAQPHRVFFERPQAGDGLARAADLGPRMGDFGREFRGVGGNAAEMHEEIQRHTLGRQQAAGRTRNPRQRRAGRDCVAIPHQRLELQRRINQAEGAAGKLHARDDAVFARIHRRRCRHVRRDRRIGGDVAGTAEILDQGSPHLILDHQGRKFGTKGGHGHRVSSKDWYVSAGFIKPARPVVTLGSSPGVTEFAGPAGHHATAMSATSAITRSASASVMKVRCFQLATVSGQSER